MSIGGILLDSDAGDAVLSLHLDFAAEVEGVVAPVEIMLVVDATVDDVVVVQVVVDVDIAEDWRSILIIPSFGLEAAEGDVDG